MGNYNEDGYAHIRGLIPKEVARAFMSTLKGDMRPGAIPVSRIPQHSAVLKRPAFEVYGHVYKPMNYFLWALTPTISRLIGRDLLPTYDYFRIYRSGDICRVHSDRQACEHSLSLTLELGDNIPWALSLEKRHLDAPLAAIDADFGDEPFSAIPMNAGDAVMYRGVNHRHGRIEPNPNSWSAHMFLHWVDPNGPYADHAFDRANIEAVRSAGGRV